jgi:GDSL-like Lipase/Acylhydrolase family
MRRREFLLGSGAALVTMPARARVSRGSVPFYEGIVATRLRTARTTDGTKNYIMARSAHFATENLTSIKVGMQAPGGLSSTTYSQAIEYFDGTSTHFTQLTWSTATSISVGPGNTATSDYVTLSPSIPSGALFWVRTFSTNTQAIIYNIWQNTFLGEATQISATPISDLTMGGTITNSGAFSLPANIIIGHTQKPSVLLVGDSIAVGGNDTEDTSNSATGYNGIVGYLAKSFNGVPFANFAVLGGTSGDPNGQAFFGIGSHLIMHWGTNDFYLNSRSATTVLTNLNSTALLARAGQKIFVCTCPPRTDSSNHQLSSAFDAQAVAFNTAIRGNSTGITGLTGFIDPCTVLENSLNGRLWGNFANTTEGIHPSPAGTTALVSAGIVPVISWP